MEPETRYTFVGAVVLLVVAAAVAAVLWLAGGGARDGRFYAIVFETQSLEGLQVGGDVNMRGIKVGRVERLTIERDNINRVRVRIRVDGQTPVSDNTVAVISRNLLTGIARINLQTPGTPGPELLRADDGQSDPVIPEGPASLERIAESANRIALTGEETLSNLNALLSPGNRAAFAEVLSGVRDASRAFQQSSDRIARVAEGVLPLAARAEGFVKESGAVLLQAQSALREFERAAATIDRQAESLGRRAEGASDLALLELRATSQDLRRAADGLAQAVERLAEPRAALIGPSRSELGPGERVR